MSGSSDSINYSIRPNKSVERKLIVEALSELSGTLDLPAYRYMGFGAMWFVDFILVHRFLRIQDMISMEMEDHERAEFNRPLSCIQVVPGESTTLLKEGALPLIDKKLLVWFDYDGKATESVLSDLRMVLLQAQVGSILMLTVNASKGSYTLRDEKKQPIDLEQSINRTFGSLVPSPFPKLADTWRGFQELIATILMTHMKHEVTKGRQPLEFVPLFNFGYEDNTPMVTVGGILCDADLAGKIARLPVMKSRYVGGRHIYIDVPPLTFREKLAFDRVMPKMEAAFEVRDPSDREGQQKIEKLLHDEIKLKLKAAHISNYASFYRHYPVFWDASA